MQPPPFPSLKTKPKEKPPSQGDPKPFPLLKPVGHLPLPFEKPEEKRQPLLFVKKNQTPSPSQGQTRPSPSAIWAAGLKPSPLACDFCFWSSPPLPWQSKQSSRPSAPSCSLLNREPLFFCTQNFPFPQPVFSQTATALPLAKKPEALLSATTIQPPTDPQDSPDSLPQPRSPSLSSWTSGQLVERRQNLKLPATHKPGDPALSSLGLNSPFSWTSRQLVKTRQSRTLLHRFNPT